MPTGPKRRTMTWAAQPAAVGSRRRRSSTARGYGRRWGKARLAYLSRPGNAFCRHCEVAGKTTAATEVDHVTPHRGDQALFWDQANWQPLCKSCHSRKTAREDGGFGHGPAEN